MISCPLHGQTPDRHTTYNRPLGIWDELLKGKIKGRKEVTL